MEVAELWKQHQGSVHQLQQAWQLVAGGHWAGLNMHGTKNQRNFINNVLIGVPRQEDVDLEFSELAAAAAAKKQ